MLTLGYTSEQIAAACIPAVEAQYEGTIVTGASDKGPWVSPMAGRRRPSNGSPTFLAR